MGNYRAENTGVAESTTAEIGFVSVNELHSQSARSELFHCCLNCTAGFTQYSSGQRARESSNTAAQAILTKTQTLHSLLSNSYKTHVEPSPTPHLC